MNKTAVMQKIAVVGMSCIFPGALCLEQFKRNIMEKRESIIDVPDKRWIVKPESVISSEYRPDTASSKRAGLVTGFKFNPDSFEHKISFAESQFDPAQFLIDRDILLELDPLHQMVLHAGRDALSQCWSNEGIRKRAAVVLAAISLPTAKSSELAWQIMVEHKRASDLKIKEEPYRLSNDFNIKYLNKIDALAAGIVSVPAAMLARAMGLMGGSFTLDAACASSLYAIKIACEQLNSGRVDMMVAGGVSGADSLYTQIGFTQLRALSPSGRCSPFDKSADGLVVGEGAGIVVLKRLEDAVDCGDHIWGVITGAGWSNDIEGNLVAPASEGQIRAMRAAYKSAGWLPSDVQYIECHGSATPVGDNIELNSIISLWREAGLQSQTGCAIGSIKSMIGHLLTAAGIAGFIKTLLAMDEKILPPSLNFSEPTQDSPLHTTGFHVQTKPEEWNAMPLQGINGNIGRIGNKNIVISGKNLARRAGISAFGFGGINAHILVEEFRRDKYQAKVPAFFTSRDDNPEQNREKQRNKQDKPGDIAIVGMEVIIPAAMNLDLFKQIIFSDNNELLIDNNKLPKELISLENLTSQEDLTAKNNSSGLWIKELTTYPGEFHIPPNQIDDLLPQHLVMLKAAMGAIKDAGISPRPENISQSVKYLDPSQSVIQAEESTTRTDFGAAIGIEFDYGATDFHIRWKSQYSDKQAPTKTDTLTKSSISTQNNNIYPPLTAERTLGALGGIVASRIAREFKLGGPCFTISAQAASGMKVIDIAIESLHRGETKIFLCGCVDMAGDIRQDNLNRTLRSHAPSYDESVPFDSKSKGIFPSEGAAAIVLKTLEQAQKDGDRIYAVIKGTGTASGGQLSCEQYQREDCDLKNIYRLSLSNALNIAGVSVDNIGLYQSHGSGDSAQDSIELNVIKDRFFSLYPETKNLKHMTCAIGSTSSIIGDTHAVSGLLSIIQSALAIYHQIIPRIAKFTSSSIIETAKTEGADSCKDVKLSLCEKSRFYFPKFPSFWIKDNFQDKRIAVAASMTTDGTSAHVVLEEFTIPTGYPAKLKIDKERESLSGVNLSQFYGSEMADKLKLLGRAGKIAFLYPGSGNHFPGMGRKLGVMFPDILRDMDESGASLNKRLLPDIYYPRRVSWANGWQDDAARLINSHAHNMIFGQVSFGVLMTRVAEKFGLKPDACIGHSLGETAGLFSLRVWNDPEDMLRRMEASDLFTEKLAGDCTAAKKVWELQPNERPQWRVAAVNRTKDFVDSVIKAEQIQEIREYKNGTEHNRQGKSGKYDRLYLLIVNTPDECVIGGSSAQVEEFIKETGCGAMYLDGVVTVHCPVAKECEDEYRDLHRFECYPPDNIDFYSCFSGKKYTPETEATANSILNQALYGFDYTELINNAWDDGVRVFIEMGPGSSCTRAVNKILGDKPHLAVSLSSSSQDEDEEISLINALSTLADYALADYSAALESKVAESTLTESILNLQKLPTLPNIFNITAESAKITTDAHVKFLELSENNMLELGKQFACLAQIASTSTKPNKNGEQTTTEKPYISVKHLFDRNMCMEFATGAASNVLGSAFKIIDSYPVRVRLPDEPLMLVDRIMDIQGEMLSLKSGKIITQHDVKSGAWYLDGGKAPVSISIEAGQADLFLCSWLGIDHVVKGKRRYRLLDAKVTFHRTLPEPGETIEYHIEIDRFLKQGEIYLFFFHYQGFITAINSDNNPELLISMRDGCAGFFTLDEVKNSGGIILKKDEKEHILGDNGNLLVPPLFVIESLNTFLKVCRENYTDSQVEQLRVGNLEGCFGSQFKGILLGKNLRLPGSRMHLIDRVLDFNPTGGRFGMGFICAEADIHPDDWFLTCHFVDDMVMPGTLMYECCAHALRVFTQRIGWITTRDEPFYDVIPGVESDLKCRGPVTVETKKGRYEIEIKEIGYMDVASDSFKHQTMKMQNKTIEDHYEPYIIADAHMFSDDHRIVLYKNMGMRIVGLSRSAIELFWNER